MYLKNRLKALALGGVAAVTLGCNMHAMTGDLMAEYSRDHMGPYIMGTDDLGMACEAGVSLSNMLLSYQRVTSSPDQAAVSGLVSAAGCAEVDGFEAQLRQMRAVKLGQVNEAKDARIAEKRARGMAASRYFRAYQHLVAHYGEPGDSCPKLEKSGDQLVYLLGLIAGAQAVQHDRASNGAVGVPLDLPRKVERAAKCLNNETWWGVPDALRAGIWTSIPGAAPEGVNPWDVMARSAAISKASGVRMALVVQATAAAGVGKTELVRQSIKDLVAAQEAVPVDPKFRLLDLNSRMQMQFLSDQIWTDETGHRTPAGGLGTFPQAEAAAPPVDTGLMDGLEDDEPSEDGASDETK